MRISRLSAALALALSQGSSYAQVDAGAMLTHTQEGWQARHETSPEGLPLEYYPRMRWTDDFSVHVERVVIQGNTRIPTAQLQVALKKFIGKRIMVDRFGVINATLARAYREAGYQAKVYIPEQTFGGGRLIVQIVEL